MFDLARPLILYLSRGMFTQLTDASSVMAAIAEANGRLANRIQINTVALVDSGQAIMWETTFLRHVAAQHFQPYANSFPPKLLKALKQTLKPPEGKVDAFSALFKSAWSLIIDFQMITVNSTADHCVTLKELFEMVKPAGYGVHESESVSSMVDFRYVINFGEFRYKF